MYVDTNNNTNNNKQKIKKQNNNKKTEADLLEDRKVCERNDYDMIFQLVTLLLSSTMKNVTVDK